MANNGGGCLGKLIGWAVVVVLVVVVVKSCGLNPFSSSGGGCDVPAAAGPVAHADDCDDLRQAALDPAWAARQQQRGELRNGKVTTGLFFTSSPDSYTALSSGKDNLSDRAAEILTDAGYSDVDPYPATHVEAKIAARMHDDGTAFGVLVINNAPVCSGDNTSVGCVTAIPAILPKGARLYVWAKNAQQVRVFTGRGS